jgi:hypothetical protein
MGRELMVLHIPTEIERQLSDGRVHVRTNDADGTYELAILGPDGLLENAWKYSMKRLARASATSIETDDADESSYHFVGCVQDEFVVSRKPADQSLLRERLKEWQPAPKPTSQVCARKHSFVPLKTASEKKREREEKEMRREEKDAKAAKRPADDLEAIKSAALEIFHTNPYLSKTALAQRTGARVASVAAVLSSLCNHVTGGERKGLYVLKPEFGGNVNPQTGQGV